MAVALPLLGGILIVLLALDVFVTIFHAQGQGGPLTRRWCRLVWSATRAGGQRADGSKRQGVLALGGPALVVSTLLLWVLLLVVAYTLVYYPWIHAFLVSPGTLRTGWLEALYYSGYTAATLGLGDVVADPEALRLVTVLEAFGGFALLSVSTSYFLAVYRELVAMQSLASDISSLFSEDEEQVARFTREEGYEALARWSEQLSSDLSRVLVAHHQYPVLHYFRPREEARALPVQLGALLRLRSLVATERGTSALTVLSRHPSYLALMNTLDMYLAAVDRFFVPGRVQDGSTGSDKAEKAHARLLDYMSYS
jgi:hypothetical protein